MCLGDPYATSDYKPSFLSDDELKQLVVEVREGIVWGLESVEWSGWGDGGQ